MRYLLQFLVASLAHVAWCASAAAQCSLQWQPGDGVPGVSGQAVYASTMWDPDGAGPLAARLVVAGNFTSAGDVLANNIAAWDPVAGVWSPLGAGIGADVFCLAALQNGDLVAGGTFTTAGGSVADFVARWDGNAWSSLGSGTNGQVRSLTVLNNGMLVAGGAFTTAGGAPITNLAMWDGTTWSGLAATIDGPIVAATQLLNGDLVVGGGFTLIHGVAANQIARWDGVNWWPLGAGVNGWVSALHTTTNGDLIVAGSFTTAGGSSAAGMARFNGSWIPMGTGLQNVFALATLPNGDVAGGTNYVNTWNGSAWSKLGGTSNGFFNGAVWTLTVLPGGDLVAGGLFSLVGVGSTAVTAHRLARFDGTNWSVLAGGTNGSVAAITELPNGDVVAVGSFRTIGGVAANRVARRSGTSWSPLGTGVTGELRAAIAMPDGSVVVGGQFSSAGGVFANNIARWDGVTWSPLGSGTNTLGFVGAGVRCLTLLPNGDLIAGGYFTSAGGVPCNNIARWNGSSWSSMGSGLNSQMFALATLPNGDVVAGGYFWIAGSVAANHVARWDGTSWSALGTAQFGPSLSMTPLSLAALPNGDVVAAGSFWWLGGVHANNIARWNGASWSPLGPGVYGNVNSLAVLPNGDIVAGGRFTLAGIANAKRVARWDGAVWSAMDNGLDGEVYAVEAHSDGSLLAGGSFTQADDRLSAYFARLTSTCPAAAVSFGSGCVGSGGVNALAATSLPWTGSNFRAVASGMPANSVAIALHGFSSGSVPLQALLPQGLPGCSLLVPPDLFALGLPTAGTLATELAIPNDASLAGSILYHQVVPFEFDLSGNLVAVTSSNAVILTIGTF